MESALTLKELILLLIGVGIITLICYCIGLVKNLIITVKHTNNILADSEITSHIIAARTQDVDKIIDDVKFSVADVSDLIKGNQNKIKAITCVINSVTSLRNLFKQNEKHN